MSQILYEVVLEGFDGNTDETDKYILWGKAKSEDQIKKYITNIYKIHPLPQESDAGFKEACTDFNFLKKD